MTIRLLTTAEEIDTWAEWSKNHPQGSLWQSVEWKRYQEDLGRLTRVYAAFQDETMVAAALVVIDRTAFGLSTWDIPRGPLAARMENEALRQAQDDKLIMENFVSHITKDAKDARCLSFYFSPPTQLILNSQFSILHSSRHEQPEATRILDLTTSDEEILAQMHQKGRYNIKVAEKNGVRVEQSTDIDAYYDLAKKTGGRDGFGIPSKRQLQMFLETLPGAFLLLAYADTSNPSFSILNSQLPIAGLIGITHNTTGIYYYGASDYEHRALMAPYLLQWEAIKLCKKADCTRYDLLGIAPIDAGTSHSWSGISSFKEKFGGTVVSYPPEQEIRLKPIAKILLGMKRRIIG